MVSLLSRGVGLLVKSLAGLSCTQATRCQPWGPAGCSSLPGALSAIQCSAARWFSKQQAHDDLPKRPLTSYLRFVVQQRPLLVKQYPEAKLPEISKLLALEWRGLSESARQPYIEAANEELLKYKVEVRKYKEKLTPLELELLKEKRKRRLVKRKHIRYRRELTILGKPKGPRNAYNIFMSEHFQDARGASLSGKMKSLHEDWRILPHSQKQMYIQLAQDDKIRYENEMKAWEEQMLEIGREDLIRLKARKRLIKDPAVMHKAKSIKQLPKKRVTKITKPARGGKEADKWKNEE
ncbi:transcription factor A, mitochondrial isoform X1 [Bufo bufo]|uniref:transcription factor A, mitochondrial isoform X1 n=1 Tax=Bufo bufo TaxID=8384 RepID=UPI001ABE673E|nr:transcription factor A, mitochondrial isoform X1 [Bufo bufo]